MSAVPLPNDTPAPSSPEVVAPSSEARPPLVVRLVRFLLSAASIVNLLAVLILLVLIGVVSERWWLSAALTYLPRAPYAIPSLLLIVASLLIRRRWVWVNLASLLLIVGPLMGLRLPWETWFAAGEGEVFTVVTCNIEGGQRDVKKLIDEFKAIDPDIVVLQEAAYGYKPFLEYFHELEDWSIQHRGEYLVASRYPVKLLDVCRTVALQRATAVLFEIEGPSGPFLLCNVHLTTARYGLFQLRIDSPVTGVGVAELERRQELRGLECFETRGFASQHGIETPLLAVGDFNMPTTSSFFKSYWSDLASAFDTAGFGYGYTSPCDTHRHWPSNTPWLRIDHILCSDHWTVEQCSVGRSDGSDHRLVAARLRLK